jgi:cytochrome c oxidase subunit III
MTEHAPHSAAGGAAIQFENVTKQLHAGRFGMWVFLSSELLLFGGLFALYTAYRIEHGSDFVAAMAHNNLALGTTNTFILIISSFFVAWSIHAVRHDRRRTALWMLGLTLLIGALFLLFKGIEYGQHFEEGIYPGQHYRFAEMPQRGAQLFFTLYFFMTGLHAIHMIGGMVVIGVLTHSVYKGKTNRHRHLHLELGALYWHLVDSIWIFLWPMFYLMGQ